MFKIKEIALFIFLIILIISSTIAYQKITVDDLNCKVQEKERIANSGGGKYLIFCEDKVLENTDAMFHLKFDSSDIYRKIETGKEYNFKVYGWRIKPLSIYKNIIKIK